MVRNVYKKVFLAAVLGVLLCLAGCSAAAQTDAGVTRQSGGETSVQQADPANAYTADTPIADVMADPVLGDWGRLLFPAQGTGAEIRSARFL